MVWQRARNMDRLRSDSLSVWPGMTIYDIGDTAHARGRSGHNPDDTVLPEGGTAELSDPDSKQEVRSLDWMIGPHFTAADARDLVAAMRDPRSRPRLYYVIYNRRIYRRDGSDSPYTGSNPHTDHVHGSGWWEDDENTAPWAAVLEIGEDMAFEDDEKKQLAYVDVREEAFAKGNETVRKTDVAPAGGTHWGVATLKQVAAEQAEQRATIAHLGEYIKVVADSVDELKARPPVVVDQAMLEAALRKVLGSVDGATPRA